MGVPERRKSAGRRKGGYVDLDITENYEGEKQGRAGPRISSSKGPKVKSGRHLAPTRKGEVSGNRWY